MLEMVGPIIIIGVKKVYLYPQYFLIYFYYTSIYLLLSPITKSKINHYPTSLTVQHLEEIA